MKFTASGLFTQGKEEMYKKSMKAMFKCHHLAQVFQHIYIYMIILLNQY